MKQSEFILLFIGALIPFAINYGLINDERFMIVHLLFIGSIFIYFLLKFFRHYNYTFSKATSFRLSLHVDQLDIFSVALWGLTLYQYFEINRAVLLLWLFAGLFVTAISFFPNILISEALGVKLRKGDKWDTWESIDTIIINDVCWAYHTKNGKIIIPLFFNKINKNKHDKLIEALNEACAIHDIPIQSSHSKLVILAEHADFSIEDGTLDDFIGAVGDYMVFTPNRLILSDSTSDLYWSDMTINKSEEEIELLPNSSNGIAISLKKSEYTEDEWLEINSFLNTNS